MAESKTASRPPSEAGISQLLRNPDLLRLLGYWRSKRSGRAMPSRRDVDPTEIPWALSRIFLVDYSAQDGFRYRLAGSEIARSEEHTSELQSLMRISYAVFCLKKKTTIK